MILVLGCSPAPVQILTHNENILVTRTNQPQHREHWQFPVPVEIDPGMRLDYIGAVISAVSLWNRLVGQEVLYTYIAVPGFVPQGNQVRIHEGGTTVVTEQGSVVYGITQNYATDDGRIIRSTIHLFQGIPAGLQEGVVTHELGHALGLAHDVDDQGSLMYVSIMGNMCQTLREEDVELVRLQTDHAYRLRR